MSASDSQPVPELEPMLAHSGYVRALARELVNDAALARDVEQETWLVALENAPRDPEAQRGWLATIVRNLAFKAWRSAARRRTRETVHARSRRAVPTPAEILERADLHRRLVESLNALDEPYRAALVLRYLEGLPPRDVARALGVPVETVRTRIKRGLELLRARLDRASGGDRGAWCLLFVRGFRLGPPSLAKVALTSLSTSLVGASVMTVLVLCAAFLYLGRGASEPAAPAAAAAALRALARTSSMPSPLLPAPLAAERTALEPSAPAPRSVAGDALTIAGRVLDPDGQPVAGADVYLSRWHWDERYAREPLASTRSDAQGRFSVAYRKDDPRFALDVERPDMWQHVFVAAFAPGFGPGWQARKDVPEGEEAVLKLVRDVPIRGRMLDLDGQPVAGARMRVLYIDATPEPESLDGYLEKPSERHGLLSRYFQLPPAREITCETGADGRFELRGIGRERYVHVDLRGPTIAQEYLRIVTRPIEPISWDMGDMMSMKITLYGSELDWVARPTRPVTGVVRDEATRKPLAGVEVQSYTMTGVPFVTSAVKTTTDADGRFRLIGMPKGAENSLLVVPSDDQPYLMRNVDLPDPAGMAPVEVEVGLHRGVWITGRLTERETGKPVFGHVHYLPFLDNPNAQKLPEFADGNVDGEQRRYATDADGRFRLVGLPGRAIVGATAIGAYLDGYGAESIEGADEEGAFKTFNNPINASSASPNSMRAVDIPLEATTTVCDLELSRGAALTVELLDPQGNPLGNCKVQGRAARGSYDRSNGVGPRVEVVNLGPKERRLLRIHNEEADLGLAAFVSLADGAPPRLTLQPCATFVGRLLDQGGAPVEDAVVRIESDLDFDPFIDVRTDAEGRFRFEHVVSGIPIVLGAAAPTLDPELQMIAPRSDVVPGSTKDLGDVRVKVR